MTPYILNVFVAIFPGAVINVDLSDAEEYFVHVTHKDYAHHYYFQAGSDDDAYVFTSDDADDVTFPCGYGG